MRGAGLKCQALYFTGRSQVFIKEEPVPRPQPGEVLVQTQLSAISSGTELLIYRGQVASDLAVDATIPAMSGRFEFPLKYGYSAVGKVVDLGPDVSPDWEGRTVFAFHPHQSHFVAGASSLIPVPRGIPPEGALFLPNMETAVNFLMDGRPLIGERVVVFGQGVVGLLTTALLAEYPLEVLVTLDKYANRRAASLAWGADASLNPIQKDIREQLLAIVSDAGPDLIFELSGEPIALQQAISVAPFDGRIVVGSWYGEKLAELNLGERFHRNRVRLVSSQVSTLAPRLTGRWTQARRIHMAWRMISRLEPERLITQRFALSSASDAFQILDQDPGRAIQVVLDYR